MLFLSIILNPLKKMKQTNKQQQKNNFSKTEGGKTEREKEPGRGVHVSLLSSKKLFVPSTQQSELSVTRMRPWTEC